jgi:transcriptional regulator with XRE-family HTH domain
MESIGEFFRQVRETKGLTLDDVASKTRIHPDFLIALEEGNFTKLPDQVFAKGFVRSYARSLGLDEEEAMRRFEGSAGAFYHKQAEREQLQLQQAEDDRRRKTNRKVVAAATGVALLGLVLLVTREQGSVAPHRQPAEVEPPAAKNSPSQAGGEGTDHSAGQSDDASSSSGTSLLPPPLAAPSLPTERGDPLSSVQTDSLSGVLPGGLTSDAALVLDLEALELTWVVVQVDGGSPQEALLRPGERVRWKGNDRFLLTLGNAAGVRVELNGKVQGPFGPSGKVVRDIVIKRS